MTFHIVTLFPESFDSYINSSIIGRALNGIKPRRPQKGSGSRSQASGKIKIKFYNPRDFTEDKHRRVDQKPYGGGPGMVLEAASVIKAVEAAIKNSKIKKNKNLIIWLSPSGKQFDNKIAENYAKKFENIIIICGRYEGIDARVKKVFKVQEISIGNYVITGGELAAMVILDTVARRIPGVLGKIESVEENRVSSSEVYTRPEVLIYKGKKYRVPKILLSGHKAKIEEWKKRR